MHAKFGLVVIFRNTLTMWQVWQARALLYGDSWYQEIKTWWRNFKSLIPGGSCMLCTAQFGGAILKASGRVQYSPFQLDDRSPIITHQHTAGGSVSQLSQLTKLSPWLTLSIKDITTSFWYDNQWCWFYLTKPWVYIISLTQWNKICAFMVKNKCGLS